MAVGSSSGLSKQVMRYQTDGKASLNKNTRTTDGASIGARFSNSINGTSLFSQQRFFQKISVQNFRLELGKKKRHGN
jgi:hypothetical protein